MLADREIILGIQGPLVAKDEKAFDDVHPPSHGLYSLGTVPDDGFIKSVCVSGAFSGKKKKGVVYIFIIDSSNSKLRGDGYKVSQKECRKKFDNTNNPRMNDLIAVYIPQEALQINFKNDSKLNNIYMSLEHNVTIINETKKDKIWKGLKKVFKKSKGHWQWKEQNSSLELNIHVKISRKINYSL